MKNLPTDTLRSISFVLGASLEKEGRMNEERTYHKRRTKKSFRERRKEMANIFLMIGAEEKRVEHSRATLERRRGAHCTVWHNGAEFIKDTKK